MPTLVGACDRRPICSRERPHCGERFCSLNGVGLAENNPKFPAVLFEGSGYFSPCSITLTMHLRRRQLQSNKTIPPVVNNRIVLGSGTPGGMSNASWAV